MNTFAKRLKYAMDQAGLKQAGLAEKSGAPRSAISQYLSGRNTPGPERMRALADATGVSLGFLTGEEKPPAGAEPSPLKKISSAAAAGCLGKSNQFVYTTPYGQISVGTKVEELECEITEERIFFSATYAMEVNYEYVAHNLIRVEAVNRTKG